MQDHTEPMSPFHVPVGAALKAPGWAAQLWSYLAKKVRADHSTVWEQKWQNAGNFDFRMYLHVVVAPSRRLRPGLGHSEFTVRVQRLRDTTFPGDFHPVPTWSSSEGVGYEMQTEAANKATFLERGLYVRPSGVVESIWSVAPPPPNEGPYELPLVDAFAPLWRTACAVRDGMITDLMKGRRWWKRWARVDWFVTLSSSYSTGGNPRRWDAIKFPGEAAQRAHRSGPSFALGGLATDKIRGLRQRESQESLMKDVVTEYLVGCGYLAVDEAVADTIAAYAPAGGPIAA